MGSAKNIYRIYNEENEVIFEGGDANVKEFFNLAKGSNISNYANYGMKIKGKYFVEKIGSQKRKTAYEELLDRQVQIFQQYDTVVGYRRDIKKNIKDLKKRGINVVAIEREAREGKRKTKYYILEKK